MQLRQATITSKGQVTIPKDIREFLKIGTGDHIDFVIGDEGDIYADSKLNGTLA